MKLPPVLAKLVRLVWPPQPVPCEEEEYDYDPRAFERMVDEMYTDLGTGD